MAAAACTASVLSITLNKCQHLNENKSIIAPILNTRTFNDIFDEHHNFGLQNNVCSVTSQSHVITPGLTVGEVVTLFNVRTFVFTCEGGLQEEEETLSNRKAAEESDVQAVNAFQILMAGGRTLPPQKSTSSGVKGGISRKDELFNDLVDEFKARKLDFPKAIAGTDGTYFIQVICNALWYITDKQTTINDTALRCNDVSPVPPPFDQYTGYNDTKRKKIKSQPLSSGLLNSHAEALFSLLNKPFMNSSPAWKGIGEKLELLAECFLGYKKYLDSQARKSEVKRNSYHPVRTVDKHATVEHRKGALFVKSKYSIIEKDVKEEGEMNPVIFDESKHLENPFENNSQRYRFFNELQLSFPVDIIRYCPGGSIFTTVCVVQVALNRTESQLLTQGARMVQKLRPHLKEYHTRSQKKAFKMKLNNIAKIQPNIVEFIYHELALDESTANHPDMQQRLRLIFLGEQGLLPDLRHLNPGRPSDKFDTFFEVLGKMVEEVTVADERRHGVAHMAQWISLSDMIKQAANKCPPDTLIPSKSLVRLQFAPTNPYTKTAMNFTSRLNVQHKIQRRQLRIQHPDDHYCAAILKYLKCKSVEMEDDVMLLFCDDKAKVPVGNPGCPVSTGVRGRQSIAPVTTELVALDHDMTSASLTPSVVLHCSIPDNTEKSFVRGQVYIAVNDSVFQASSPFRHATMLKKIIDGKYREKIPSVLFKYTDGGTDQRNTLESVKIASICLFKELDFDLLITARCAPGHSYRNPAERVMSVLNYGLQNCATERKILDEKTEDKLKRINSMSELRKHPELREKWTESIEPVQSVIRNRFQKLSLKDEPMTGVDSATDEEIDILKRHARELFPGLDLSKLQKIHTKKCKEYNEWKDNHCLETNYTFQIKKCLDGNCCLSRKLESEHLKWLPNPMLDESKDHFQSYEVLKEAETTEIDRPSLKIQKQPKQDTCSGRKEQDSSVAAMSERLTATAEDDTQNATGKEEIPTEAIIVEVNSNLAFSTQNARAIATCVECCKPRVIYSKLKLSQRQQVLLATSLSEYEYTCGSYLFPPSVSATVRKNISCRTNLQCVTHIEIPYYSSELGRNDLCVYCGIENADIDAELKKKFKTVLPLCDGCQIEGKTPFVQRPFGKQ